MKLIKINSYSKINLTLNILAKREDGYHEIETIMQSINLADKVIITETEDEKGIKIKCNHPQVPVDNQSLAYRSAEKILNKLGIERGVRIEIDKKIPLASGMAGGSANSATILVGLNKLFDLGLTNKELREIGEELGMDIPFCIQNGTALAYQRGEKITLLSPIFPPLWIVVVNPGIKISTQWAYRSLNLEKIRNKREHTKNILTALKEGSPRKIAKNLYNSFEDTVIKAFPVIGDIKNNLLNAGALGALMSGSGPTVFGIAQNEKEAVVIYKKLEQRYDLIWVVHTI